MGSKLKLFNKYLKCKIPAGTVASKQGNIVCLLRRTFSVEFLTYFFLIYFIKFEIKQILLLLFTYSNPIFLETLCDQSSQKSDHRISLRCFWNFIYVYLYPEHTAIPNLLYINYIFYVPIFGYHTPLIL